MSATVVLPKVSGSSLTSHKVRMECVTNKPGRLIWTGRTSDVFGSLTDIESDDDGKLENSLAFIRRKIQERCQKANTRELMGHIRRLKIGHNRLVTPNEFRATLMKFGINLPQSVVDKVFSLFDQQRSGTMDFDEFAMWIMNAEFHQNNSIESKGLTKKENFQPISQEETLRAKLSIAAKEIPQLFINMKKKMSFLELVSELNSRNTGITESEARTIFLTLEKNNATYIDVNDLAKWAGFPIIDSTPESSKIQAPDLQKSILKICGRDTTLIEKSFAHIPRNEGVKLSFEEFRRTLLSSGLGQNNADAYNLFWNLTNGRGRSANNGSNNNDTVVADMDLLFHSLQPFKPEPNGIPLPERQPLPAAALLNKADRRLRESIRKSYKPLKAAIEAADPQLSGYIDPEVLNSLLNDFCMPVSYQDFRYVIQQIKHDDNNRVCWVQFLQRYNPRKEYHSLLGTTPLVHQDYTNTSTSNANGGSTGTFGATGSANGQKSTSLSASLPAVSFAMDEINQEIDSEPSIRNANYPRAQTAPAASTSTRNTADRISSEIRKVWQNILRECQRCDVERVGLITRADFVSALEHANLDKSLTPSVIQSLAHKYSIRGDNVDYTACIRNCLNDLVTAAPNQTNTEFKSIGYTKSRETGSAHPWDFGYKRDLTAESSPPYWKTACADRKAYGATVIHYGGAGGGESFPVHQRASAALRETERENMIAKYDAKVISICEKCYKVYQPIWRSLRMELKRGQLSSYRGCILKTSFVAILEHYGIKLSKTEIGTIVRVFRTPGMQDVVNFDDFLKVCYYSDSTPATSDL